MFERGRLRDMMDREKNAIPPWAMAPLSQFSDSISSTHDFYHLTIDGLQSIIHHHEFLVFADARVRENELRVIEVGGKPSQETKAEENRRERLRKQAKERADLARHEVSNGFPVLHTQQIVSLWSSIECFVEDVLVAWLSNDPEFLKSDRVRKIKIPVADFESLSESERKYFLASELQRDAGFSQRNEIEKFELLLALVGLSGNIDPDVKRNLIELGHIRNVLLHRRGIADTKFVQACAWLTIRAGEHMEINSNSVDRYTSATISYCELMLRRIKVLFKVDVGGNKHSV